MIIATNAMAAKAVGGSLEGVRPPVTFEPGSQAGSGGHATVSASFPKQRTLSTTSLTREQRREQREENRRPRPSTKDTKRMSVRRRANKVLYHEAVKLAGELGIELGPWPGSIADVLEKTYRRTHALWLHAASEADQLDADAPADDPDSIWTWKWDREGNRLIEPSKWVQYEQALRQELFDQAARMAHLKIDERRVKVEEKQVDLLGTALAQAMQDADIPEETRQRIGSALRRRIADIESTAEDLSHPHPPQHPHPLPPLPALEPNSSIADKPGTEMLAAADDLGSDQAS